MFSLIILIFIILLFVVFRISITDIKYLLKIKDSEKLNSISNKISDNVSICKEMLKILNNKNVVIEEDNKTSNSLYIVIGNKIIIGSKGSNFAKFQTIAHECIHSIQNRKLLICNYVISNIYNLFGIIGLITVIVNRSNIVLKTIIFCAFMLVGIVKAQIRNLLEKDAMSRAPSLANEYFKRCNKITKDESRLIQKEYKEINRVGIKIYSFLIYFEILIKSLILSFFM